MLSLRAVRFIALLNYPFNQCVAEWIKSGGRKIKCHMRDVVTTGKHVTALALEPNNTKQLNFEI